jgi:hypothetical protein
VRKVPAFMLVVPAVARALAVMVVSVAGVRAAGRAQGVAIGAAPVGDTAGGFARRYVRGPKGGGPP